MFKKLLNELQREGIMALEYADEYLRQAEKEEEKGNHEKAGQLRLNCHAHRHTASSLAWVYSRTMDGACAADVTNLWDRIRSGKSKMELAKLCGIGFEEKSLRPDRTPGKGTWG